MRDRSPAERLALIVLAAVACWCGSAPGSWAAQPAAVESLTRTTLRLIGRFNAGHACVLGPRFALTNAHVVDQRPFDQSVALSPFSWSDGDGHAGFLVPVSTERIRDLGTLQPLREADVFPHYLPVAAEAPKPGDRVYFLGYDWGSKKAAMGPDVVEARVTRIVALHVLFVPSGKPGSSGSCLVNEAGEVVAINEGGFDTDDGEAGISIGVWGDLAQTPKE